MAAVAVKALYWVVGILVLVLMLEAAPKVGGALLLAITVYLLVVSTKKGVV